MLYLNNHGITYILHYTYTLRSLSLSLIVVMVWSVPAVKKYNELFPKEKKEKSKKGGAEGGAQGKGDAKKQEKKPKEEKEQPADQEEQDDTPKPPKFKDPYLELPPR